MEPLSLTLIFSALLAGFLMFIAPCTLPLIPAFLAYLSGTAHDARETTGRRQRLLIHTIAYCAGFSTVFILLGVVAGSVGGWLSAYQTLLMQLGGVLVLLVGLSLTGIPARLGWVKSAVRVLPVPARTSPAIAYGIGVVFALGWSPCIGPVLATILLYASATTTAASGALLLAIFSLGLAVPFLMVALLYDTIADRLVHSAAVAERWTSLAGWLLIVLGLLLVSNSISYLYDAGYWLFAWLGFDVLYQYF